jgi:hypothetical protein
MAGTKNIQPARVLWVPSGHVFVYHRPSVADALVGAMNGSRLDWRENIIENTLETKRGLAISDRSKPADQASRPCNVRKITRRDTP